MEYIEIIEETPSEQQPDLNQPDGPVSQNRNKQVFIEANTIQSSLSEIKSDHIIPVYIKDNETLISQAEFIESTIAVVKRCYPNNEVLEPIVRVSHPMKGRIPEARNKAANELLDSEKTLYYERMAFIIEIPSVQGVVDGNLLSLTVGGVKSYSFDNLYSRKGSDEHFKIFIGFKNAVCTNMCIWSDGFIGDLKVKSLDQLRACITAMVENYNSDRHLQQIEQLTQYALSEQQFATLIGKCRMYQHLPSELKRNIPSLLLGDSQINSVCREFYRDENFSKDETGSISLWKLYNLFTGANKTSYIDSFLDRSVNSYSLVDQIRSGLENKSSCWYLSQ